MTLYTYVLRRFLVILLRVQVILLGTVLLFDSVETMQRLKDLAAPAEILMLTLVRAPALISQTFPLVILIASLWTYLGFARSSELVVSRAVGISGLKLIWMPVVVSMIFGVIAFAVVNPVVSATRQREQHMLESINDTHSTRLSLSGQKIWLRQGQAKGQMVIQAAKANADGTALFDVRIFQFDSEGRIDSRTESPQAKLLAGRWRLENAKRWSITAQNAPLPVEFSQLEIPTELTSEQLLNSFALPDSISFWDLPGFIARMEKSGFSGVRHRQFFQSELSRPLVFVAMTLIGAAFSMRPARFGNVGLMLVGAVFAGFTFYFLLDVAASFGAAKQVPVLVAAWAPPVAAIMLALALLLHLEDG